MADEVNPFPQVRTRIELDTAPGNAWVECASCLEHKSLDVADDPLAWPDEHVEAHPGHARYRVVRQTNFRAVPSAVSRPPEPAR